MARFDYLDHAKLANPKKKKKDKQKTKKGKIKKPTPESDGRRKGKTSERVEVVYIRTETVQAVWREVKKEGGESVSELVEDLLLAWLRERA